MPAVRRVTLITIILLAAAIIATAVLVGIDLASGS
jgi:hypothetical protein